MNFEREIFIENKNLYDVVELQQITSNEVAHTASYHRIFISDNYREVNMPEM